MNKRFHHNLGKSLIIIQQTESILAWLIVYLKRDKYRSIDDVHSKLVNARTVVMEALKNQLKQIGFDSLDYDEMDEVIKKRNWLVHRLVLDNKVVGESKKDYDLSEEYEYFENYYLKILNMIQHLGAKDGLNLSRTNQLDESILELGKKFKSATDEKTRKR